MVVRQGLVAAMLIFAALTTVGQPIDDAPVVLRVETQRVSADEQALTVIHGDQTVLRLVGGAFEQAPTVVDGRRGVLDLLTDVTGDGQLDLVVSEYTGGGHLSHVIHVIDLVGAPRTVARVAGGGWRVTHFEDVDGDGRPELRTRDWTFAGWRTCVASSPAPQVTLRLTDKGLRVAWDLMASNDPLVLSEPDEASSPACSVPIAPQVWGAVLEGLYTGRRAEAWRLLQGAWPEGSGAWDTFQAELLQKVAESPYGSQLLTR
jgi:hypothetical protein